MTTSNQSPPEESKSGFKKNCNPERSYQCGNTCIANARNCRGKSKEEVEKLGDDFQKQVAEEQAAKKAQPKPEPKPQVVSPQGSQGLSALSTLIMLTSAFTLMSSIESLVSGRRGGG